MTTAQDTSGDGRATRRRPDPGLAADPAANGRAALLRALHRPGDPLVLVNVWDAASARLVEAAGFPAVATASAAIAPTLGYADGEATPVEEMLAAVGRIVRSVAVPVTADLERGYGLPARELVERLAATGAVGCNLEDSDPVSGALVDAAEQADFLAAVRASATELGWDLVLNARIDTQRHFEGTATDRYAETVRRARRYLAAGADCVYPIFLADAAELRTLTGELDAPVNVLFRPGAPTLADLADLGVARVSFGPGLHRAAQAGTSRLLAEIRAGRSPYPMAEPPVPADG